MSDPFLSGAGSSAQRELQRLMRENKELRQENARLKLQLNSRPPSQVSAGLPSEPLSRRRGRLSSTASESTATTPAATAPPASSAQAPEPPAPVEPRAPPEAVDSRLVLLRQQFEAYVNATCEREQAYKLVYAGIRAELEERRLRAERLEAQAQEMRRAHRAALEAATAARAAAADPPAEVLPSTDRGGEVRGHVAAQAKARAPGEAATASLATEGRASAGAPRGPRTSRKSARTEAERDSLGEDDEPRPGRAAAPSPHDGVPAGGGQEPPAPPPPPTAETLVIASGAGALRDAAAAAAAASRSERRLAQQRARRAAAAAERVSLTGTSTTGARRGRPPKAAAEASSARSSLAGSEAVSLFASFTARAAEAAKATIAAEGVSTSSAGAAPAAALSVAPPSLGAIHFGADPIESFVALMERTPHRAHRALLCRKFMTHLQHGPAAVAATLVARHGRCGAREGLPLMALWKEVGWLLEADEGVRAAVCEAVTAALVHRVGPDGVGVDPLSVTALHTLATVLRLVHIHGIRQGRRADRAALLAVFLEVAVSVLRVWRLGHPDSPLREVQSAAGPSSSPAAEVGSGLEQFCTIAVGLWGATSEWVQLMRYYNAEAADAALSLVPAGSLSSKKSTFSGSYALYAVQAVVPACLVTHTGERERWQSMCDALGWSGSRMPVEPLGEAALRCAQRMVEAAEVGEGAVSAALADSGTTRLATAAFLPDPCGLDEAARAAWVADSVLCLRLLVLQRGLSYLQTVMEGLHSGGSGGGADAVFVRLVSFAVVDLHLRDSRDEQCARMTAFLHEFILAAAETVFASAEEFVWSATDAHVLAVRAVLELCGGDGGPGLMERGGSALHREATRAATRWLAAQRAALALVKAKGGAPPVHPLTDTALGRQLLDTLPPLSDV